MISELFDDRVPFWRTWHPYVLTRKGLTTDADLRGAIEIDIVSSLVAAQELQTRQLSAVISLLPLGSTVRLDGVGEKLDHLGFRIQTPMDVYLEVLPALLDQQNWTLEGTKRFAPSTRFQERVGATAEMAQVWVQTGNALVELELFDIHAPPSGELAAIAERPASIDRDDLPDAINWIGFEDDDIWHYGVRLDDLSHVQDIHRALVQLPEGTVSLKNQEVVANLWHGSHHTKVVGGDPAIEIEFLAYITDWSAVV